MGKLNFVNIFFDYLWTERPVQNLIQKLHFKKYFFSERTTQLTFACSKSMTETSEKNLKYFLKLTIKKPERHCSKLTIKTPEFVN